MFNTSKVHNREVIAGTGDYMCSTRMTWDLFLGKDLRYRLPGIERFDGDGIIADFNDPAVAETLRGCSLLVVTVGSSCGDAAHYPAEEPYVATDNGRLIALAYRHLIGAGPQYFTLYSLPQASENRRAQGCELAFMRLHRQDSPVVPVEQEIYRGLSTSMPTWHQTTSRSIE